MSNASDTRRLRDCKLVPGVRAVPPDAARNTDVLAGSQSQGPEGARPFREAGWVFASEQDLPEAVTSYPVIRDSGGQLKIVAPSMNIKFKPDVSGDQVASILDAEGLEVRRKLGFAANSFIVNGSDVIAKARRLNANQAIEWAEPTTIEPLGSRR